MAHISSNCLYLDQHDTGHENNRTYEVIEVDKETRRKDFKIVIYSTGLACSLIIFAMLFLNVIKPDIENNLWSTLIKYTCYFILIILVILFIYAIAKVSFIEMLSFKF